MTLVLIHGGGHSSRCWEPTIARLRTKAIARDLPGRGSRPGPLDEIRIQDFVDSVLDDINTIPSEDDVVLVGHSLAGVTIPAVIEQSRRQIRHVIFVACGIPRDGESLVDLFPLEVREAAARTQPTSVGITRTEQDTRAGQTYDMNEAQAQFTVDVVVPEAYWPMRENVSLEGLRRPIGRTWIRLLRDRTFSPDLQTEMAARARCSEITDLDAGHMAMISRPDELAAVLDAVHASVT